MFTFIYVYNYSFENTFCQWYRLRDSSVCVCVCVCTIASYDFLKLELYTVVTVFFVLQKKRVAIYYRRRKL